MNIVLRLLSSLAACGIGRVLMMPDREGLKVMLQRHLARKQGPDALLADVEFLDMPVTARMMREAGVGALIVLGGDGTHRAVVRECGDVPLAGLSTGTNNAYPEMREPTISGLAAGLYATGRIPPEEALASNKRLEVEIRDKEGKVRQDIALVDAVILHEHFIGARALWKIDQLAAVYVSYADPGGLAVELGKPGECEFTLNAPIAPGLMEPVPIANWARLDDGVPHRVQQRAGIVALDGERELAFKAGDEVTITLKENAFRSIDVAACMRYAARSGLIRQPVSHTEVR